jgi:DNA-directed RNA polymerase specialized sigma24 family protein
MEVTPISGSGQPEGVRDAAAELAFLRRFVATLAHGRSSADVEDVASDAWIRLDRTLRREPARDQEALMKRVARFAWVDHCRSLAARSRAFGTPIPAADIQIEAIPHDPGADPNALALWRFAIYEWFTLHHPPCLALAHTVFSGRTWTEAAETAGARPNSLAKRWQRCRDSFLTAVRGERGSLREILRYFEDQEP